MVGSMVLISTVSITSAIIAMVMGTYYRYQTSMKGMIKMGVTIMRRTLRWKRTLINSRNEDHILWNATQWTMEATLSLLYAL